MGRQHTMYISDSTWGKLEMLQGGTEKSMSAVIRRSVDLAIENKTEYDLNLMQELKIEALEKQRKFHNDDKNSLIETLQKIHKIINQIPRTKVTSKLLLTIEDTGVIE